MSLLTSTMTALQIMFLGAFVCLSVLAVTPEVINRSFLVVFICVEPKQRKK